MCKYDSLPRKLCLKAKFQLTVHKFENRFKSKIRLLEVVVADGEDDQQEVVARDDERAVAGPRPLQVVLRSRVV